MTPKMIFEIYKSTLSHITSPLPESKMSAELIKSWIRKIFRGLDEGNLQRKFYEEGRRTWRNGYQVRPRWIDEEG